MGDLSITLIEIGFVQLVLAFAFVISYALAIGGMFGAVGRRRALLAAVAAAVAFTAMTKPWVNGALLVVFAIAGIGLFITLVWALSLLFGAAGTPSQGAEAAEAADAAELGAAVALIDAHAPADTRVTAAPPIATSRPERPAST